MRLIIVMSSLLPGGAERVALDMAGYLQKKGNEVHLLVARVSDKCPMVYEIPEGVRAHYIKHGAENDLIRPIGNAALLCKLSKELSPDWIISLGSQYKLLKMTKMFGRRRVLLSERNYPKEFYSGKEMQFVDGCYRMADAVVFQTNESAECFPGLSASRTWIIPNAVRFSVKNWSGQESNHIVFVGRLEPQKNPAMLIESFEMFLKTHKKYTLDIYGDGSLRSGLEHLADERGISPSVIFHGHSNGVLDKMASALAYVSTSDYEGISNSMLEAMSMGMPCVCTDCAGGGARLAISDGENGLLVPCGDTQAMSQAMSRIADSDAYARKLGDAARASMDRFAPDAIYGRWIEILEDGLRSGDKKC